MPWRIEDELKELGANYVRGGLWRGFAVRNGNFVTGLQNLSSVETARWENEMTVVVLRTRKAAMPLPTSGCKLAAYPDEKIKLKGNT
jgi:hypothetical protein